MKRNHILLYLLTIMSVLCITLVSACTVPILSTTPDTIAPTVSSTIPVNAAKGVAINSAITVIFSETMNPLTIISVNFTLKQGDTPVLGTVSYSQGSAIFVPANSLAPSTPYTATITTGVKDSAGNAPVTDFVWNFTTGESLDISAPTITGTIHANGATNIPINAKVGATFSEAVDPLTVNKSTFILKQGGKSVSGTVSYSNVSAVFVPLNNLAYNTVYTVTITTGVKDLAGNPLAAPYTWSWTTGMAPDITPPTVTGTVYANGVTDVPINAKVGVIFSEAMDPLTVTNVTFTLKQGNTPVLGTISYSNVTAVFVPLNNLAYNTVYTVTITTGVKDLAGNPLAAPYTLSWTTGMAPDTIAPNVKSTTPTDLTADVATNSEITVVFSEMLDPLTVTNVTFTLKQGTSPILGIVTYAGLTATFTPSSSLASSTIYTVTITTGIKDLAGNALASNFIWSFTTGKHK
jgi:hypothetical protein